LDAGARVLPAASAGFAIGTSADAGLRRAGFRSMPASTCDLAGDFALATAAGLVAVAGVVAAARAAVDFAFGPALATGFAAAAFGAAGFVAGAVAVVAAVLAVGVTGWAWLDPVIAFAVAGNIVFTGASLLRRSAFGLMDQALPSERVQQIEAILDRYRSGDVEFHAIRTRAAAGRSFVSMHVLVPGTWTVKQGHDLVERLEHEIATISPGTTAFTHIEPREDPSSYDDIALDRRRPASLR
jgi:cation diffusion facilitator family transporter